MNATSPSRSPSNLQLVIRGQQEVARQSSTQELQTSHVHPRCPLCQRHLPDAPQQDSRLPDSAFSYVQRSLEPDYFASLQPTPENSRPSTPVQAERDRELSEDSFVPGYFSKFFSKQRSLGRGARGTVYLVQHVLEQHQLGFYACKIVSVGDSSASLVSSLREIKHLESLRHHNITSYHHSWLELFQTTPFAPEVPHLFILMSFANGGSMEDFIAARRNRQQASSETSGDLRKQAFKASRGAKQRQMAVHYLRVDEICALFRDMTSGLEFLHTHNILHLDLKADNVLLNWEDLDHPLPTCLLSDFGSSTARGTARTRSGATGTLDYLAPECLQIDSRTGMLKEQDFKADLWSLGLLLHVLCFLRLPYQHEEVDPLKEEIASYPGYILHDNPRHDLPFALERLMSQLINLDPHKRPSAAEVLKQIDLISLHTAKEDGNAIVRRPTQTRADTSELVRSGVEGKLAVGVLESVAGRIGVGKDVLGRRCVVAGCVAIKMLLRRPDHPTLYCMTFLVVCVEILCMNIQLSVSLTVLYVAVSCIF